MTKGYSLKEKSNILQEALGQDPLFTMQDIKKVFPEKMASSLYWDASQLVEAGYLIRIRNGVFKLKDEKLENNVSLSAVAKQIRDSLQETGFEFYISGIDILSRYQQHIPESYPIIVYVQKTAIDEVKALLVEKKYFVTRSYKSVDRLELDNFTNDRQHVLLIPTENFTYSEDNFATTEKAFLDLYHEITRNEYPLALQELARIYRNLVRSGALDQKTLVKAAYARNMQYDIRYIVESKYISDEAKKFVTMVKEEIL